MHLSFLYVVIKASNTTGQLPRKSLSPKGCIFQFVLISCMAQSVSNILLSNKEMVQ